MEKTLKASATVAAYQPKFLVRWPPVYIAKYCKDCGAELSGDDLDYMGEHSISHARCINCLSIKSDDASLMGYCNQTGEEPETVKGRVKAITTTRKKVCILSGKKAEQFAKMMAGKNRWPMVTARTTATDTEAVCDILQAERVAIVYSFQKCHIKALREVASRCPGLRFVLVSPEPLEEIENLFPANYAFGYKVE